MRLDYSRRVLLYILSVKNQLYLSAQSERSNSVCAKRNIIYGEAVTSLGVAHFI